LDRPFTKNRNPFIKWSAIFAVKKFTDGKNANQATSQAQGSTLKSRRNQETDF
jgi:hypothetical protein